ncbi:uncharacterized protein [Centroberyx affinis]|uniref:uncharacterized protein n=1 Tax=Centroberyx affinis TaxID=166261 RepID=UPI003A5C3FA7
MATADKLVDQIFSWIQQGERCAEQLRKLAKELESLRKKCNASECVGNSVSVVGAACLVGAGVATLFTGGAAAPFLAGLGAVYGGTGVAVSVATKLTEHFISSDTMKDAEKLAKKSNEIEEKIKQLFRKLKKEREAVGSDEESDDEDQYIIDQILGAMARRSGMTLPMNMGKVTDDEPRLYVYRNNMRMRHMKVLIKPEVIIGLAGVLAFFTFQASGKKSKFLFLKGAEKLIKEISKTGFKTAAKGGAMVVGGAVGLAFALPEAIDNWKEMVKENHVTEASQSLRKTADDILNASQKLKEELDNIKRIFEELAQRQQSKEYCQDIQTSSEEDSEDDEETFSDFNSVQGSDTTSEEEEKESDEQDEESDSEEEKQSDEQDEESDSEEEKESDEQDEESDSEEEKQSDEQDEESDSEEEKESVEQDEESDSEEEKESDEQDEESDGEKEKKADKDKKIDSKNDEGKDICQYQDSSNDQDHQSDDHIREQSVMGSDHECENDEDPGVGIRMGLLNVRSLTRRTSRILELITQNNLDVFFSTETWLRRGSGDRVLSEASPENFRFLSSSREGRGGGVAIQYSDAFRCRPIFYEFITTFEYVAMVLQNDQWDAPIILINVYHPPGYNMTQFRKFLDEFLRLLDEVFENYDSIILTGDFNIQIDNGMKSSAIEFYFLLLLNDLDQHVNVPTHRAGHTLDLVITRNVEISRLSVRDDGISDHYTVIFNAIPVSKDGSKNIQRKINGKEKSKRFKKKK